MDLTTKRYLEMDRKKSLTSRLRTWVFRKKARLSLLIWSKRLRQLEARTRMWLRQVYLLENLQTKVNRELEMLKLSQEESSNSLSQLKVQMQDSSLRSWVTMEDKESLEDLQLLLKTLTTALIKRAS